MHLLQNVVDSGIFLLEGCGEQLHGYDISTLSWEQAREIERTCCWPSRLDEDTLRHCTFLDAAVGV
jgi:hypothetical protein